MAQPMSQVQIILDANTSQAQRSIQAFQSQIGTLSGAVQNVNQGFINSAKIINNFRVAAQRASQQTASMASALRGLAGAGTAMAGLFAGARIQDGIRSAMGMVDDYRKQVLAIATTLTDTVSGDPQRVREAFAQNTRHAERFFRLLQVQSAKSIASFEELANAYQLFTAKGLSLSPNAESAQMLANIVDRILLATKGQASQVQVFQELRAILNGTSRPGDVTASIFKMHDPNYLQRIRAIYQTSQNPGQDLIRYLNTLTSGMDMSDVLGQLLSKSFARLKTSIHIWVLDAFSPVYDQLVAVTSQIADFLSDRNNPVFRGFEDVRDFMVGLAGGVKSVWDGLGPIQGVLLSLAPKLLAVGSAMATIAGVAGTISLVVSGLETAAGFLGAAAGPVGWGLAAAGAAMVVSDATKQAGATYLDREMEEKAGELKKFWDDFAVTFQVIAEGIKRTLKFLWGVLDAAANAMFTAVANLGTAFMTFIGLIKLNTQKIGNALSGLLTFLGLKEAPVGQSVEGTAYSLMSAYNRKSGRRIPAYREVAGSIAPGAKERIALAREANDLVHGFAGLVNDAARRNDERLVQAYAKRTFEALDRLYDEKAQAISGIQGAKPLAGDGRKTDTAGLAAYFTRENFTPQKGLRLMSNMEFLAEQSTKLYGADTANERLKSAWQEYKTGIETLVPDVLEGYVKRGQDGYRTVEEQAEALKNVGKNKAEASRFVAKGENFDAVSAKLESEYKKTLAAQRQLLEIRDRYETEAAQYGATGRAPGASANVQLESAKARIGKILSGTEEDFGSPELKRIRQNLDLWQNDPAHQAMNGQAEQVAKYQAQYVEGLQKLIDAARDQIQKDAELAKAQAELVAQRKRAVAFAQEADRYAGKSGDLMGRMAGQAPTADEQARLSGQQKVMELASQIASLQREISGETETEAEAKARLRQEQERYNALLPQALQTAQEELDYQRRLLDLRTEGGALNGVKAAVMGYSRDIGSTFDNVKDMALKCIQTVQSSLSDALFNVMTGQFDQFKDFFRSFVNGIIRIWTDAISQLITKWLVLKLALGLGLDIATAGVSAAGSAAASISGGMAQTAANMSETSSALSGMSISLRDTSWASGAAGGLHLGGFANGGIAPGGFHAFANGGMAGGGGVMDLPRIPGLNAAFHAFANGGTVHSPTVGLVGEGRYNEAIVPLPDGRSIPVVQKGPGLNVSVEFPELPEWPALPAAVPQQEAATAGRAAPTVTVNINDNSGSDTSKTVNQREDDDGNLIIDVVIDALARNRRGFRRTLQQYAGNNA